MSIRVCLAGATGWAGSALARGIVKAEAMDLVGAVARSTAGKNLGEVLAEPDVDVFISGSVDQALEQDCDVFVEYTKPDVAKSNILYALDKGSHVVVGTSGLSDQDYAEIEEVAIAKDLGVVAVGNFAMTVALLQKFSELAAKYIPSWEVIDYAHAGKVDAPSGTARELAHRLGEVGESQLEVSIEDTKGSRESRGARLNGSQVHSVRLPGHILGVETIFGLPDEKLVIRHEAGASAEPYVSGALLAIENVGTFSGLKRGLDHFIDI